MFLRPFLHLYPSQITGNADDLHWTVERRYTEFYNLEAKLTAFHPMSEFEDAKLPPRPKLFSGRGLDVLQQKKRPFEEYLKCLLQKPSLKNSDILFTFLTSSEEFTEAATSHLGLAKMIKNVPMKLTKERGQGLQGGNSIDNFPIRALSWTLF